LKKESKKSFEKKHFLGLKNLNIFFHYLGFKTPSHSNNLFSMASQQRGLSFWIIILMIRPGQSMEMQLKQLLPDASVCCSSECYIVPMNLSKAVQAVQAVQGGQIDSLLCLRLISSAAQLADVRGADVAWDSLTNFIRQSGN